jgi:transcriptional antiterminator NusG
MTEMYMKNWYAVLYVKSRHGFVAHNELIKKDVETFLPAVKRLRQWKDRKKRLDFPLFPGYLFININPSSESFVSVLKTRGAINLLSTEPGHPTPVSSDDVGSLQVLIESGRDIDIYPELKEGTRVRVKRGPIQGAEGTLGKRHDQYLLLINIRAFMQMHRRQDVC